MLILLKSLSKKILAYMGVFFVVFLFIFTRNAIQAQLKPENIAILATQNSEDSLKIARHYALSRKIPPRNVYLLPPEKSTGWMSRSVWEKEVRPDLQKWLLDHPEVKCMVCCWNVPYRIGGYGKDSPQIVIRKEFLLRKRKEYLDKCTMIIAFLDAIGRQGNTGEAEKFEPDANLQSVFTKMDAKLKETQKRLNELSPQQQKKELPRMNIALQNMAGIQSIWGLIRKQYQDSPETISDQLKSQALILRFNIRGILQTLMSLQMLPESTATDAEILRFQELLSGVLGSLRWVDSQLANISKNESSASFDSELSAIFMEGYPLFRWIPNYMSFQSRITRQQVQQVQDEDLNEISELQEMPLELQENSPETERWVAPPPARPVLMVARLEAPTVDLVLKMIDSSISVEEKGLEGDIYLDARGKRPGGTPDYGSYAKADQSLHDLAQRIKTHTNLNVILDDRGGLLTPADCPKPAALYCGWYSMGKYIHGCDWAPGSVGYHMASMEAGSLKSGELWCPQMLRRGVAATLGPAAEPYLSAFPPPDEFYSLILTGKYTMIECYYYTKAFNSWVMVYVGDPLYTPYKKNPALKLEDLPGTLKIFFKKN
ncbi:MAG: TIGR03790 family protein [Planctomycetia bacterium]|nr:TIGR03790 family protein [Planctomycetia bacterium]